MFSIFRHFLTISEYYISALFLVNFSHAIYYLIDSLNGNMYFVQSKTYIRSAKKTIDNNFTKKNLDFLAILRFDLEKISFNGKLGCRWANWPTIYGPVFIVLCLYFLYTSESLTNILWHLLARKFVKICPRMPNRINAYCSALGNIS